MAQGTGTSDYRALVCVFLQGGNDGHGTVIATDPDSFSAFTQARSGAPGLAYPMSELLPIVLRTPQSGRTFALNPALSRSAEPVQRRARCDCRQYGHLDRSRDQGAGQRQLGSVACFVVLALRSDSGVAGHRFEWRQRGTRGMGRRGGRCDREHEHEFKLDVHLHFDRGDCAVSLRTDVRFN